MFSVHAFEDKMLVVAELVGNNKYLNAIKDAFTVFMPMLVVGSFGTLLKTFVSSTSTGLAQFVPVLAVLDPAFGALTFGTLSFMALPIIFMIAMNLSKYNGTPQYVTGVVAVAAYMCVVPTTVSVEGVEGVVKAIDQGIFGSQGLFIGMVMAIMSAQMLSALMRLEWLKIKMPPSVPSGIASSFNVMIPSGIALLAIAIFGCLFHLGMGFYFSEFIFEVLQAPLQAIYQSPVGLVAISIFCQLFWVLGIHGGLLTDPIRKPLQAAALAANVAAVNAGLDPTNPVTNGFSRAFVGPGGGGLVFSLVLALLIFSKRDDMRSIAKIGFIPAACAISEPVVFGLPLVMNPIFAIPFVLGSGVSSAIAMFFTSIGFLPCNVIDTPFGVPVILNAFIGHGWQGVVVQLICIAVGFLMYLPFVFVSNRQAEREAEAAAARQADAAEPALGD